MNVLQLLIDGSNLLLKQEKNAFTQLKLYQISLSMMANLFGELIK